eukprot:6174479-Pleurochrysis_carterae.AAC.4
MVTGGAAMGAVHRGTQGYGDEHLDTAEQDRQVQYDEFLQREIRGVPTPVAMDQGESDAEYI